MLSLNNDAEIGWIGGFPAGCKLFACGMWLALFFLCVHELFKRFI